MSRRRSLWKDSRGAALLEFVFCFPILFVLFLFAMQFAYIMITWQVVHYSAYMGARSAMTVNNLQRKSRAETVVKRILAVVSASPSDSSDAKNRADDKYIRLDGWGRLPNTKYLDDQVKVEIPLTDLDPRGLQCTVKFKMFLLVPVAGSSASSPKITRTKRRASGAKSSTSSPTRSTPRCWLSTPMRWRSKAPIRRRS